MSSFSQVPKAYFIALFCEAIMHGIYTVVFCVAMFLLLRTNRETTAHKVFIGLTLTMYSISTAHVSLSLRQSLVAFFQENATNGGLTTFNDPGSPWLIGQTSLELINCLIGDSIVAWRAWVLWGGGTMIIMVPAVLIVTGAVTGSLLVHAYTTSPISKVLYNSNTTLWLEIFGAVTFTANLYSIGVIAFKAWQHERAMKGVWAHGGRFHRALLVVIESGTVYCLVLAVIVILIAVGSDFGVIVVVDILAHLTGIYPSIILILVSAKLAYTDEVERNTTLASMRYNRAPAARRRRGRGELTTTGETESTAYALEPIEVNIRARTSRSDVSSKPFMGAGEDGDSMSGKRPPNSEEAVEVTV